MSPDWKLTDIKTILTTSEGISDIVHLVSLLCFVSTAKQTESCPAADLLTDRKSPVKTPSCPSDLSGSTTEVSHSRLKPKKKHNVWNHKNVGPDEVFYTNTVQLLGWWWTTNQQAEGFNYAGRLVNTGLIWWSPSTWISVKLYYETDYEDDK